MSNDEHSNPIALELSLRKKTSNVSAYGYDDDVSASQVASNWQLVDQGNGAPSYYWNKVTNEVTYDLPQELQQQESIAPPKPPPPARRQLPGMKLPGISDATPQSDTVPPTLTEEDKAWKIVEQQGTATYYWNTITNGTTYELPSHVLSYVMSVKDTTPEVEEEDSDPNNWSAGWDDNSGRAYYYNMVTGITQWECPQCLAEQLNMCEYDTSADDKTMQADTSETTSVDVEVNLKSLQINDSIIDTDNTNNTSASQSLEEGNNNPDSAQQSPAPQSVVPPSFVPPPPQSRPLSTHIAVETQSDPIVTDSVPDSVPSETLSKGSDDNAVVIEPTMTESQTQQLHTSGVAPPRRPAPPSKAQVSQDSNPPDNPALGRNRSSSLPMDNTIQITTESNIEVSRHRSQSTHTMSSSQGRDQGFTEFSTDELCEMIGDAIFEQYVEKYFIFDRKGLFKSRTTAEKITHWKSDLIKTSLRILGSSEATKDAVQLFRNITGYMGDRDSSKTQTEHLDKILKLMIKTTNELRDEIYCQIVKQITENPNIISTLKGWELLLICLNVFPPSNELKFCLMSYISHYLNHENVQLSKYADMCLHACHKICYYGAKLILPTESEIEQIKNAALVV